MDKSLTADQVCNLDLMEGIPTQVYNFDFSLYPFQINEHLSYYKKELISIADIHHHQP
jgi:hypothetical protein